MATTPKQPTVDELREAMTANRLDGYTAVRAARDAELAAKKASGKDDYPTPINDWCESAEYKTLRDSRPTASGEPRVRQSRSGPKATYTRDGKPLSASHDSLSYMAYACTRKILSEDSERMGVKEFKELLAKKGIDDPEHTTWEVTLPNGVLVGATMPADRAEAKAAEVKAEKVTAKKAAPATEKAASADQHFKPVPKPSATKATGATKKATSKVA